MKFGISLKIDEPAKLRSSLIHSLDQQLRTYFSPRDYGKDIQDYVLLIICVGKASDQLFPTNKPTYVDHKVSKNRFTGVPVEMNKLFMNEVKLDQSEYAYFLQAEDKDAQKLLAKKILQSLGDLDTLPRKVRDFDKLRFKNDMEEFFRQYSL